MSEVQNISCGGNYSLAVTSHGKVFEWGGLWGNNPQQIKSLKDLQVNQISCGSSHSLVVTERKDGVYMWSHTPNLGTPKLIPSLEGMKVSKVGCTETTALIITEDRIIWELNWEKISQLLLVLC